MLSRGERYNLKDDCEWPIDLRETKVENCNFNFIIGPSFTYKRKEYQIVILPEGANLYHGTILFNNTSSKKSIPPIIWFTSTLAHQGNINSTHVFEFTVKEPLVLVFEHNLTRYGSHVRGKEYIPIINGLKFYHRQTYDKNIDGYIGCNECEIGLFAESFMNKLEKPPVLVQEKGIKYLD